MTELTNLSSQQLRKIADLKEQIENLEAELSEITGAETEVESGQETRGGRRTMSASAKARIAAAQRARWAKFHAAKGEGKSDVAPKKKRKMSAAGRAKIAAAARARWAKAKAAGKTRL